MKFTKWNRNGNTQWNINEIHNGTEMKYKMEQKWNTQWNRNHIQNGTEREMQKWNIQIQYKMEQQ